MSIFKIPKNDNKNKNSKKKTDFSDVKIFDTILFNDYYIIY